MPFARPASTSPSGSSSYQSNSSRNHTSSGSNNSNSNNNGLLSPTRLATPWDASSLEKQLESMRQEAAAATASSSSSSSSSLSSSIAPPVSPLSSFSPPPLHPSGDQMARAPASSSTEMDMTDVPAKEDQSSQPISFSPHQQYNNIFKAGSSPTSPPPSQLPYNSHRAMKQRLFQMSDDESETIDDDSASYVRSDYHSRLRAERQDPTRRSISALSGVTVIGRGSISSNRDSRGSIDTIGSFKSNQIEEESAQRLQEQEQVSTRPSGTAPDAAAASAPSASDNRPSTSAGGDAAFDMPSALQLLQMYPGRSSPPANFDAPPLSRTNTSTSVSSNHISPRSHSIPLPTSQEGGQRPVRRHSRSGAIAGDLLMSPVTNSFNENLPTHSHENQSHPRPTASAIDISQSKHHPSHSRPEQSPRSSNNLILGPASLPDTTTFRSSSPSLPNTAPESSLRSASTSRSISNNDLAQIMRSFSRGQRSPGRRKSTHGSIPAEPASASGSANANTNSNVVEEPAISPLRRSVRSSRQASSANLKELIRQKRRQASAPFYTTASADTSGTTSPILQSGAQSPIQQPSSEAAPWEHVAQRRARSRRASAATSGLHLSLTPNGFQEARLRAMRGVGEVVMTPSVEEWKQLGLDESLNNRNGSESSDNDSDSESSSSSRDAADKRKDAGERQRRSSDRAVNTVDDGDQHVLRPRMGSITSVNRYYGSLPPSNTSSPVGTPHRHPHGNGSSSSTSYSNRSPHRTLSKSPKRRGYRDLTDDADISSTSALGDSSESDNEGIPQNQRTSLPTLSRQSLSVPAGSPMPGIAQDPPSPAIIRHTLLDLVNDGDGSGHLSPSQSPAPPFSPSRPSSPIPLGAGGPLDPRAYSAVTGLRSIKSFNVQGEAGKGAYGLVRKVRELGPDGRPTGPDLMLKYIVKQRILADAYKRHKMLGVVPMEIHVLDFIRRIYRGPGQPPRDAIANIKRMHGIVPRAIPASVDDATARGSYGHPNLCQMLDFFEDGENYYLVMSCFGSGQDLFDYVDAAPTGLSITESKSFLTQIVDAIAFLHSHGVVHRDIKDENVVLDGKGGVQLIDFGSAAYIKEGKPYFDTFSGTLDFASPEVLRGERYGGRETDVWALGVLGYVILCGECPFWSSEESLAGLYPGCRSDTALLAKATSEETQAELLNSTAGINPHDAVDFVRQCLQVSARDRPPAIHLRKHRFITDQFGWIGTRGWENLDGYQSTTSGFDST